MPTAGQGSTVYLPVGTLNSAIELRWADKGLADSRLYAFDATNFLADSGDAIDPDTISIMASPPTITIGAVMLNGGILTWLISGGFLTNPIDDYIFIVAFSTIGGQTISRNIYLRVWPLSPNKTFSTDLVIIAGPVGAAGPPAIIDSDAIRSALATLPQQSAGYPPGGGFWLTQAGDIQLAPLADLTSFTNGNLAMVLAALDDF